MATRFTRKACQIYIGNVPWTINKSDLKEYFSKFGEIETVKLAINRKIGLYKNYGFVQYSSEAVTDSVCKRKHVLDGNHLKVQVAAIK